MWLAVNWRWELKGLEIGGDYVYLCVCVCVYEGHTRHQSIISNTLYDGGGVSSLLLSLYPEFQLCGLLFSFT